MPNEKPLIVKDNYNLGNVNQVVEMAKVLKEHIVKQKLYTEISNKAYVHVEGWQFAGGLLGMYARITSVDDLSKEGETKWKAAADIVRVLDDKILSSGFALCSNKENRKKSFDEYAVLSMAQTRAIGKGYRNLVGWVMKLAGYESTPAEELTKESRDNEDVLFQTILQTIKGTKDKEKQKELALREINENKSLTDEQKAELMLYL